MIDSLVHWATHASNIIRFQQSHSSNDKELIGAKGTSLRLKWNIKIYLFQNGLIIRIKPLTQWFLSLNLSQWIHLKAIVLP